MKLHTLPPLLPAKSKYTFPERTPHLRSQQEAWDTDQVFHVQARSYPSKKQEAEVAGASTHPSTSVGLTPSLGWTPQGEKGTSAKEHGV